jgi:hypothetical protein
MPRRGSPSKSIALWAAFLLLGCSSRRQIAAAHDPAVNSPTGPDVTGSATPAHPDIPREDGVLSITDPNVLQALEAGGMSFGEMMDGPERKQRTNDVLARSARYGALVKTLEHDIDELGRADPNAGVSVAKFSHRLFDARWLRSPAARFDLVAVVNRIDRAGIIGGCGEVRFVYRLAYKVDRGDGSIASRLPMTVSFEMNAIPGEAGVSGMGGVGTDCKSLAARWFPTSSDKGRLAEWLLSERGPISSGQRKIETLRRLAVNLQSVRWPSTVRPDLGGHAEYILRAFVTDSGKGLAPSPLENTPDVARLHRDGALRRDLVEWIKSDAHLAALDSATASLPDKFLATRAVSVTPRGLGRKANRPFASTFVETDFRGAALEGKPHAGSPAALMRRLDDLTCPGCHEARSVAGFHLLGVDRAGGSPANSLSVPVSPHFERDQARRQTILQALRDGKPPDYARPLAERAALGDSGYGAHCSLGDPGFATWTCDPGYLCDRYDGRANDATVGICLPEKPGGVGDPCESGPIAQSEDPHRDRVTQAAKRDCDRGACNTNAVGFPGGMCTPSCGALPESGACGKIAILDPFNACLARNESFERCLDLHSFPAGLRRCDNEHPCRDDYICAGAPGSGMCIPPYFLFQLRVDGHGTPPAP